ncbi:non-ribosomal peptide synthetase [Tengunoibacter tsumagoiensis]|uniref:Non-ribosomal peptide synthetase n=1 Tax=Tengunoibacter tsumagoiensis TaxID=2014871 RepID=A0A402A973_9CHLR|nr:non-ribosomal peptide synthetase [Tengunoibacter tsumagoiensis]GCE15700.1 non-ribosomal peptide synthetase [Tengunoibacter tsumagoiensis]
MTIFSTGSSNREDQETLLEHDVFLFPTSFAQEQIWFLEQWMSEAPAYQVPWIIKLHGKLNIQHLQHSFSLLIQRHESLRTCFIEQQGVPMQMVYPKLHITLPLISLEQVAAHDEHITSFMQNFVQCYLMQRFDLSLAPLFRACLIQLGAQDYALTLVFHHSIIDGWSLDILTRELSACYQSLSSGQELTLPEVPLQYADVALWQREVLQGAHLEALLAYWRESLREAPIHQSFPTDYPRTSTASFRGAHFTFHLPLSLLTHLKKTCQQKQASLFMGLLAAFQLLLARSSGQWDLIVGTPLAQRTEKLLAEVVGLLVNTLPIRTRLQPTMTFLQVIEQVRQAVLGAWDHQELPFEMLVSELLSERQAGLSPFFQTLLVLQNPASAIAQLPDLSLEIIEITTNTTKFDLSLFFQEEELGLKGGIEYNTDLFQEATIRQIAERFQMLLQEALTHPQKTVSTLSWLSKEESELLISTWNTTTTAYPREMCIHHLFEQQAKLAPTQKAVIFGQDYLTYGELNARSDQLARYLVACGVLPDSCVAVCLERSPELMIALLGILKAGGAYVPLDVTYPEERIDYILRHTHAAMLLTQQSLVSILPKAELQLLCLDTQWEIIAQEQELYSLPVTSPLNLAYVMYTSGSTGRPKGVSITHRNVLRLVKDTNYMMFDASEVFLQLAPVSFDASTLEIWGSLLNGASLVLYPPSLPTLEEIAAHIEHYAITTLWLTAGLFHQMVERYPHTLRLLHQLLAGGDVLSLPHTRQMLQAFDGQGTLINGYGPTENTTFTCCYPLPEPIELSSSVPIGRPIANTSLYILDEQLQIVPVGLPGELYIGGDGLARGYYDRPDLTAERFLPHPYNTSPGERLYRTGDLVRYLPDGRVEFLGRLDRQIKLRGFRIELEEIEATLQQHPAIQESCVLLHENDTGDKQLVAFIVSSHEAPLSKELLRTYMQSHVPHYMVPNIFLLLETFPLTANGKIDRKALLLLLSEEKQSELAPVLQSQAPEELLATIWMNVLGRNDVGRDDNFFELGGHSLLAIQIISRIREVFQCDISLQSLFELPTIAALAEQLQQRSLTHSSIPLQTTAQRPREYHSSLPLSFAQEQLWFLEQWEPGQLTYLIPFALHLQGPLQPEALQQSLQALVERHESLRTCFIETQGTPMQAILPALSIEITRQKWEEVVQSGQARELPDYLSQLWQSPFHLSEAPLFRAHLLQVAENEHIFTIVIHHIIADGWSVNLLLQELFVCYRACIEHTTPALPPLSVQYADITLWQRESLQGAHLETLLTYWRESLRDAPAYLPLPTNHPRPPTASFRGNHISFLMPMPLLSRLKTFCQQQQVTLFMGLLAAFDVLLARSSGEWDLVVGSPLAQRTQSQLEGVIGMLVNTLPLRTQLQPEMSFLQALDRVRQTVLGAWAHQEIPFEKIVSELLTERHAGISPFFQILLVLQNQPPSLASVPELHITEVELEKGTTKFDLTVFLQESAVGLKGVAEYNSDLFEEAAIQRLMERFQSLLEALLSSPEAALGHIPVLLQDEQELILSQWNQTAQNYASESWVHQEFEKQAALHPDAPAVIAGPHQLSYADLNLRANELAHTLQAYGVRPEGKVGVFIERSLDLPVALLAILKAGGAYVALDPTLPEQRLAFLLADAQASLVLTQEHLQARLTAYTGRILCLDTTSTSRITQANPTSSVSSQNLAYTIYTSGSTGVPKGVEVTHASLMNLITWHQRTYQIRQDDRATQIAGLGFDASVWEIWPYLTAGASLYLVDDAMVTSPGELVEWLCQQKITISFIPTPLLETMYELPWPEKGALRFLLTGGDRLKRTEATLPCPLINHYGPTENTVVTTSGVVEPGQTMGLPSIGRPIANTQVYLLDTRLEPVPPGVVGEIYIGGDSLARGYLHRPEQTAERFIPHPFHKKPGERLYRTGDLARYLPDGQIDFIGRRDHQVKIRGFRIELGEIETVLLQHPALQEVLVQALEELPGRIRLVGYLVPHNRQDCSISAIRSYLESRLPDYMIPAAFVLLEAFPLTSNGKIDRKALPHPEWTIQRENSELSRPLTPTEQQLLTIWSQVLGIQGLQIHDNFFEVGGDSILAIQIVARAHQSGLHLTPKELFSHQSIFALANSIVPNLPPIAALPETLEEFPLTPIQHYFFEQELSAMDQWGQGMQLDASQSLRPALLEASIHALIAHHSALRLRFSKEASGWKQRISEPEDDVLTFRCIDLSALPPTAQEQVMVMHANQLQMALHLSSGPLLQSVLFLRGQEHDDRFFLFVHHMAVDTISWQILLQDLQTAYSQLLTNAMVQLPPTMTSFAHWAEQLTRYARSPRVLQQSAYWLQPAYFQAYPLPTDGPLAGNSRGSVRSVYLALAPEETTLLLTEARRHAHIQVQELVLTALTQTLTHWSQKSHLLIDVEGHGREDLFEEVDLSRTVGWFTTITPVLLSTGLAATDGEALRAIKQQLRSLPEKGIGYGLLRYLSEDETLSSQIRSQPGAQISFNYLGQFDQVQAASALFHHVREYKGQPHNAQDRRPYLFEISCFILDGQLQMGWSYSEHVYRPDTIEMLLNTCVAHLRRLLQECLSSQENPYVPADFPDVLLRQEELDLLYSLFTQAQGHHETAQAITLEAMYRLTPMQEGILFHSLSNPAEGMYVEQLVCEINGELNLPLFEQAWQEVIERHAILRTSFHWQQLDKPVQVVHRHVPFSLQSWHTPYSPAELTQFLQQDRVAGFSYDRAPLMRLTLLHAGTNHFYLVWSHHHILLDGWSVSIVFQEVLTLYEGFYHGSSLALPPVFLYQDYVFWFYQQDAAQARTFWLQTLQDVTAFTAFSYDRSLAHVTSEQTKIDYQQQQIHLSAETLGALQAFGQRSQLTFNTLVQGAWALLLHHYSREHDVIFGTTVAGRPTELPGADRMVGLFINTLPVRVHIPVDSSERSLTAWLQELQIQQVEAREFAYASLADIQRWLEVPAGQALFESLLVIENYPVQETLKQQLADLNIRGLPAIERTNYPLTAVVGTSGLLSLNYDCRFFNAETITRLLGQLHYLLEQFPALGQNPPTSLSLLRQSEQAELLQRWNQTEVAYDLHHVCLACLLRQQGERTPDAAALVFHDQILTYASLLRRVDQLAALLRQYGAGPECIIAISLPRSLELVIAIYAVVQTGAAYVPIDYTLPEERRNFLLQQTQTPLLLTLQSLVIDGLPSSVTGLCLDKLPVQEAQSALRQHCPILPETLCYVIYTSGSTGRPKGVMVPHQGIVNRLLWMQQTYQLEIGERVLQKTPVSFDVSVWELFWPTMVGACLVIARPEGHRDPLYLHQCMLEQAISTVHFVPTMLQEFLSVLTATASDALPFDQVSSLLPILRRVICSGEEFPYPLHVQTQRLFPGAEISNLYGPTEASVDVSFWQGSGHKQRQRIPIGRPIANVALYVVDAQLKPVPIGVPGELYIGSTGIIGSTGEMGEKGEIALARGYLHQPDLTASSFLPDPWSGRAGARVYRTGDLVRRLDGGELEFVGRRDQQVKIRGLRIELGEIEHVLRRAPLVTDTAVIVDTSSAGNPKIIAYLVPQAGSSPTPQALRAHAREWLPDYMLPSHFILLASLPLTTSGKLDRKALPRPEPGERQTEIAYAPAETPIEKVIADVWKEVLQVDKVGINDNFFELGGHSLHLIRVFGKLQHQVPGELLLTDLFQFATIHDLSAHLQQSEGQTQLLTEAQQKAIHQREAINRRKNTMQKGRNRLERTQ